jgi:hypothetical protein
LLAGLEQTAPITRPAQTRATSAGAQQSVPAPMPPQGQTGPLRSLEPMRALHARLTLRHQLQQTLRQAMPNAGPLHAERLVQQSLARMQTASPAYLQRFMAQVAALAAIEDALQLPAKARAQAKGAKASAAPVTAKSPARTSTRSRKAS